MGEIRSGRIRMRPRIYFIVTSLTLLTALASTVIVATYSIGLIHFMLRSHGPFGAIRWEQLRAEFPLWAIPVSLGSLIAGIFLLRRYDFSYKYHFSHIAMLFIAGVLLLGIVSSFFGPGQGFYCRELPDPAARAQCRNLRHGL